ncbi:MAG: hypothetical protein V3U75_03715 [Methylococcaceae bacterium]
MLKNKLSLMLLLLLLAGCSSQPQNGDTASPKNGLANDFPTQDRVEYVLQCMQKHGGQRYETLYPCICSADKLAEKITFTEYTEAKTFTYLRGTPGENGAVFRDPPKAKELRKKLEDAELYAAQACFVK